MMLAFMGSVSNQWVSADTIRFSPASSEEVKLMTFNIRVDTVLDGFRRWKQRKNLVVDTIKANAADVIGLQEAEMDQVQFIQRALPQYSSYAIGRKNGRQKGETCAILYRKDRFIVLDSGTFWFSDDPANVGSKDWGALWPRICSWVHLVDRSTRSGFYVYNVHMDPLSQRSRENSTRLLTAKIASRKTQDPFIVMGDFNMERDNPAMQHLRQAGFPSARSPFPGTIDAWAAVHFREPEIGTRHGFRGKTSGPMIDHIRLCDKITPLEARVDCRDYNGKYPSDHFPVIASIRVNKSSRVTQNTETQNTGTAAANSTASGGV
jgi:endonuclease/exonuclease/phosphatase family metal-dependent hydrolase